MIQELVPHVQHYPWGSTNDLPELLGLAPDGRPWAELWIGDHPRLPSTIRGRGTPLDVGLPFLLKVLAAAKPLSIQSHPSLDQAVAGFRRENDLAIPIDAPHRTYRDPNHKPELICALTPFEGLVGFRQPKAVIADLKGIEPLAPVVAALQSHADPSRGLEAALRWILGRSDEEVAVAVAAVAHLEPIPFVREHFGNDPGVLVALLLHHVTLLPGQAVFLGAGNLHAYLRGVGVEIMANSDNVVRGGLTTKHIDIDELLEVVDFTPIEPEVQTAEGPVHRFDAPVPDFSLVRIRLEDDVVVVEPESDELVLVTDGAIRVVGPGDDPRGVDLEPGRVVHLTGDQGPVELRGTGLAWRATVGQ